MRTIADSGIFDVDPAQYAQLWAHAIRQPRSLLEQSFDPSNEAISAGVKFFVAMLAISTLLSIAGGLTQHGTAGEKLGGALNGFLGLFYGAILAVAAYFPFALCGGKASFAGTYVAYCYSAGPYIPLMSFAGLIMLSGYPAKLKAYAINPATANIAFANAQRDPETSNFNLYLGAFLVWGLVIWSTVVMFRTLSFVHALTGWKLFWAILLSFILFSIVGKVLQRLSTVFLPAPPEPPSSTSTPATQPVT